PYKEIEIEFTGLRPGEKLYEELLMAEEGLKTTLNNKIFVGKPIDISPDYLFESLNALKTFAENGARRELTDKLHEIVPGFTEVGD
ncbi:MAG: polysaccharide biosynthesis protein, partial [Clostridiales bacterium]|nr:polysaccharide biosynthesis protein [Clostridiales bacterium]